MDSRDRSKRVLAALVRQYIDSGDPVPSSVLVSAAGSGVGSIAIEIAKLRGARVITRDGHVRSGSGIGVNGRYWWNGIGAGGPTLRAM